MKRKSLIKRMVVGILVLVAILSTTAMVQAREVGPKAFSFEVYQNEGSVVRYTDTYNRGLLSEYGSVEVKNMGGDVGSIKMTIYHCNLQSLNPDEAMTSTGNAKKGYTNLYYKAKWINSVCYTRLQLKASYAEAMISGYWNP